MDLCNLVPLFPASEMLFKEEAAPRRPPSFLTSGSGVLTTKIVGELLCTDTDQVLYR